MEWNEDWQANQNVGGTGCILTEVLDGYKGKQNDATLQEVEDEESLGHLRRAWFKLKITQKQKAELSGNQKNERGYYYYDDGFICSQERE